MYTHPTKEIEYKEEINNNIRKTKIIKFLEFNQGCSKEDVVRGVAHIMSKKTVYKILDELIEDNIIKQEKVKPNAKNYKLFLNSKNYLVIVSDELDNFKKEFFHLIQKTETIAKNKNYSVISNEIGLSTEDPKKWTNADYQKYIAYSMNMIKKGQYILRKNQSLLDENKTKSYLKPLVYILKIFYPT